MDAAAFKREFGRIEPLVVDEWSSIDKASLAATEGDLEGVVALVAAATPHTKPLVRRKLAELYAEATREDSTAKTDARAAVADSLHDALDKIEKRVAKLREDAEASALPAVKAFAKEHLLLSLLMMLGLGFLLGKALTPRGRRD